ncbi:hypothetical protein QRQ56_30590 [Bradyrhizobium sp. U531]|uniref:hypothetical protein n=1 Tax=Bradyrhizobium sp. U531 TaxID=3053458 RepID=UPI003F43492F
MLKAALEAVDQNARRPEARQLDDRGRPEFDQRPERHPFGAQAGRGDVLAEVAGADREASFQKRREELARVQVDLPEIGQTGTARAKQR